MPDRVIRDELLESDRWLDLPTDTDRLAFMGLLLRCDDFGNLEGGARRLFRFLHSFTQVKTPEAAATTLLHLADADLMRRYEVDKREFWHLPRFKPHRQYLVRSYPQSPWDSERLLGKERRVINRGLATNQPLAENVVTTSQPDSVDMAEGVGVGVGVGVYQKRTSTTAPGDNSGDNSATKAATWTEYWKAQGTAFGIETKQGESTGDYCRRVQASAKGRK